VLIEMARKLKREGTNRAAITRALEEFVARRRQKDLIKSYLEFIRGLEDPGVRFES
jgi:hypothetical protein